MKSTKEQDPDGNDFDGAKIIPKKNLPPRLTPINPALLSRLRDGDHEAFQCVYLQCVDSMRHFLTTLLRSADEAEELTQEVFVHLWERRKKIDPHSNFKAYLGMITKWAAFNLLDHKKVEKKYRDFVSHMAQEFNPAPDQPVITEEIALMIRISLDRMPAKQRRVFELSRFEGKTNAEIMEILNISDSTVRVHLHAALNQLKEVITLFIVLFIGK